MRVCMRSGELMVLKAVPGLSAGILLAQIVAVGGGSASETNSG